MKLHMSPVSTTSRPLLFFIADNDIEIEQNVIDLMTGEHHREPFISLNPNRLVPVLEDDGLVLTESSAILKYLADRIESKAYPREIRTRARVNEVMDWFNTNLYRELGYHLVYPQIYPHHKREPEAVNVGTAEWGKEKSLTTLQVLNDHYLAGNDYLIDNELTIADYFGAGLLSCGEYIRVKLDAFPHVLRWYGIMKERPAWARVTEAHNGFAASLADQTFITIP